MRIAELAKAAGVHVQTIRFYGGAHTKSLVIHGREPDKE